MRFSVFRIKKNEQLIQLLSWNFSVLFEVKPVEIYDPQSFNILAVDGTEALSFNFVLSLLLLVVSFFP